MSWPEPSRRALLAFFGSSALSGCTLTPLHGPGLGERVNPALAAIEIDAPHTRLGQILAGELRRELDPAGLAPPPRHTLVVRLEREKSPLAVQLDDVTTRFDLTLAARFDLVRKADGRILYRSAVRRVASYNVVRAPYATLVAEQDAERRAAKELAREIRTRLAVHFAGGEA
jgi:LPS-assembly lipoprotein